ncbi:MAG TPA: hypothetical protein EYG38_04380 [Verrucomicrobia bacterium]|nr:hypothetical protein [Verrucomicrobiota bacterium]
MNEMMHMEPLLNDSGEQGDRRTGIMREGVDTGSVFLNLCFGMIVLSLSAQESVAVEDSPDYLKDVRPIFRNYCAGCHNAEDLDGDFSVETFKTLMAGGESGKEIVLGNADQSRLIQVLTGKAKPKMPPKKEPQPSRKEIELLKAWINAGAPGPIGGDAAEGAILDVPDIPPVRGIHPAVTSIQYSPSGTILAVARFQTVDLIETETDAVRHSLKGHPGKVNSVDFSPNGLFLVAASGVSGLVGTAVLWKVESGELMNTYQGHSDILYDAVFSPDGQLIATAGYDRKIVLWQVESGKQVRIIKGHNGAVFDLDFSPDGRVLASAGADATIKLWNVSTGERLDTLHQPQKEQYAVAFDPDGSFLIAGGADNRIRMWEFLSRETPKINPMIHARFAHEGAIVHLKISSDGSRLISSADDRTVSIWKLPELVSIQNIEKQSDVAASLAIHPSSQSFTVARLDGSMETLEFPVVSLDAEKTRRVGGRESDWLATELEKTYGVNEIEPNNAPREAQWIETDTEISGRIQSPGDSDWFRFRTKAGQEWIFDVHAARDQSPMDSTIEIRTEFGDSIEQVQLQAVRDSWFTFRGKDSNTSDDFRLQNWQEMELNEFLYANGEVVKLWLYPRGPDSGFMVYPGSGKRFNYFGTTSITHPLGEPCYIVRPFAPGTPLPPQGLPVFKVYYENDDDPRRRWGSDSWLVFKAPEDGNYLVRISDVRHFGGEDFHYKLKMHPRRPDFNIKIEGANPTVSPGSGKEFTLRIERVDGYEGPVEVEVNNLPPGFFASSPIIIEAGQQIARGVINALPDAGQPTEQNNNITELTAIAMIGGKEIRKEVGSLGEIKLGDSPKLWVEIRPLEDSGETFRKPDNPHEIKIRPGQTIQARVLIHRKDFNNRVGFGTADSGRNLAHGVYIDNIGLNGLLIIEDQTERTFFITAADWTLPSIRLFHIKTSDAGGHASWPVRVRILPRNDLSVR